jgi:hypothetical protein
MLSFYYFWRDNCIFPIRIPYKILNEKHYTPIYFFNCIFLNGAIRSKIKWEIN